jgi:hypothetical protein
MNRYNIPATADEKSHDNPWNFVRKVAKPEDYVVVKLDIDNTPIEEKFIAQLRASSDLHSLIDEFYFEHHVNVSLPTATNTYALRFASKSIHTWFEYCSLDTTTLLCNGTEFSLLVCVVQC